MNKIVIEITEPEHDEIFHKWPEEKPENDSTCIIEYSVYGNYVSYMTAWYSELNGWCYDNPWQTAHRLWDDAPDCIVLRWHYYIKENHEKENTRI